MRSSLLGRSATPNGFVSAPPGPRRAIGSMRCPTPSRPNRGWRASNRTAWRSRLKKWALPGRRLRQLRGPHPGAALHRQPGAGRRRAPERFCLRGPRAGGRPGHLPFRRLAGLPPGAGWPVGRIFDLRDAVADGQLLNPDEPPPFEVAGREARSPFLIVCDHAGHRLPRALAGLGLPEAAMATHIAWDIGAGGVAQRLAAALDAFLSGSRTPGWRSTATARSTRRTRSPPLSERTSIPGNQQLPPGAAEARAPRDLHPYHEEIRATLDRRQTAGRASVSSPCTASRRSSWKSPVRGTSACSTTAIPAWPSRSCGAAARRRRSGGRRQPALRGRRPHRLSAGPSRRSGAGSPHVEIEIDRTSSPSERAEAWAERLARLLPIAARTLRADELVQTPSTTTGPDHPLQTLKNREDPMQIRVGYELNYDFPQPTR